MQVLKGITALFLTLIVIFFIAQAIDNVEQFNAVGFNWL